MKVLIFDTETTSLTKPFAYNMGYVIADTDTKERLVRRDFVVEQIWHNLPLFSSAYYAEKRPLYVSRMKAKQTIMDKFGYICGQIARDIRYHNVEHAYAFNSPFDEKVFEFCCDWFKCKNPFDTIPIHDIRGYVHHFLVNADYCDFCEKHEYFTESGNYSTTAETVFRYITNDLDFNEEHTALADSEIETDILFACKEHGADITKDYTVCKSIVRTTPRQLTVKTDNTTYTFQYTKRINKNNGNEIVLH